MDYFFAILNWNLYFVILKENYKIFTFILY